MRLVYFKTNSTVQAVQQGAAGLLALLNTTPAPSPNRLLDRPTGRTVTVSSTGWTNNWRGLNNALWTTVQPAIYGTLVTNEPCPHNTGMVSVWQLKFGMASYLCQPWKNITPQTAFGSQYIYSTAGETCGGGTPAICTEDTKCSGNDFADSAMFGNLQCVHRIDFNRDILPTRGALTRIDKTLTGLTDAGVQFDLPPGTALAGYDPTAYGNGIFGYYYATPVIPPPLFFKGWQQVPGGGVFSSGAGVAMRSSVNIDSIGRGTDNALYYQGGYSLDQGATWKWTGWQSLGGVLLGKGAITAYDSSHSSLAIAGRGTDSMAYINVCPATSPGGSCNFSGWYQVPSNIIFSDDYAIVYKAPYLYIFGREYFSATLYWTRNDVSGGFSPNNWTSWTQLGTQAWANEPGAAVVDGVITLVERSGNDNKFYATQSSDGVNYSAWKKVGDATFASGAGVAGWTGGQLKISGVSTGNFVGLVSTSTNGGSTWSAFESVGGGLTYSPAMWSPGPNRIEMLGIGSDGATMYRNSYAQ